MATTASVSSPSASAGTSQQSKFEPVPHKKTRQEVGDTETKTKTKVMNITSKKKKKKKQKNPSKKKNDNNTGGFDLNTELAALQEEFAKGL